MRASPSLAEVLPVTACYDARFDDGRDGINLSMARGLKVYVHYAT